MKKTIQENLGNPALDSRLASTVQTNWINQNDEGLY
jgi:hypothetical protein